MKKLLLATLLLAGCATPHKYPIPKDQPATAAVTDVAGQVSARAA